MKIGLYSRLARAHISKIRDQIKLETVGSTNKEMKDFRKRILESGEEAHKQVTISPDFYAMSTLRDLIFHEQEHQFDLSEIKEHLSKLGLIFRGFDNQRIVRKFQLSNPKSNAIYDLDAWQTFEQENPSIFAAMYQFWCRKPD